jgi:hypothetical protein
VQTASRASAARRCSRRGRWDSIAGRHRVLPRVGPLRREPREADADGMLPEVTAQAQGIGERQRRLESWISSGVPAEVTSPNRRARGTPRSPAAPPARASRSRSRSTLLWMSPARGGAQPAEENPPFSRAISSAPRARPLVDRQRGQLDPRDFAVCDPRRAPRHQRRRPREGSARFRARRGGLRPALDLRESPALMAAVSRWGKPDPGRTTA